MSRDAELKRRMNAARMRVGQAVRRLRTQSAGASGHQTNVVARANVITASNVGEPGSSRSATGAQRVRIRQVHGRTIEDTEVTDYTS